MPPCGVRVRVGAGGEGGGGVGGGQILREAGVRGLYVGLPATLARNLPTVCISFTSFSRLSAAFAARHGGG